MGAATPQEEREADDVAVTFMWQLAVSLARVCLFAALAGCAVDVSKLRVTTHKDAAMSPDAVGEAGRDERRSADVPATDQNAQPGDGIDDAPALGDDAATDVLASGGRGGEGDGAGGTGGSGGAWADGANLAVDGSLDGASEVAEDSAPTNYDSGKFDRAADSTENDGDVADGAAAAPEVGPADARDLGTDAYGAPFIVPSFPAAMKCNLDGSTAELSWASFSTWQPSQDSRKCGGAGAYYIQGDVVGFQRELQVLADVYAPEDSTWYPISGGPIVQPDIAGGFNGYFCLPQKGLERTFRFRIVKQNASQEVGVVCLIHVR